MTCNDCLAALGTESLREMTPDSPVMQHCATCPDCARLTTMLRDKEYETATVLNSLPPMSNPLTVAETAVGTAQRRRVGRVAVMLSGAALVVTLWIVGATIVIPALNAGDTREAGLRTETIALTCLSPQQAGDIINPYVRSPGSSYFAPTSGISAITVRGRRAELATARELIREFENDPSAACRLPMTIVRKLQEEMAKEHGGTGTGADLVRGKSPRTLLGKQGGSLLDPNTPFGRGPVAADKATTAPKKQ
jgi:glutaredoxin-related protein